MDARPVASSSAYKPAPIAARLTAMAAAWTLMHRLQWRAPWDEPWDGRAENVCKPV